jgi:hypothetical protein
MLFIYKKYRLRIGSEGKIARWVGETYVQLKNKYPSDSEKHLRIKIGEARYKSGEFDPSFESEKVDMFLTSRIIESNDLTDVVVAIIRYEIGTGYENDQKQMLLMYAVIFEELIEYDIPGGIAMQGQ